MWTNNEQINETGTKQTGIISVDDKIYYIDANGVMQTGHVKINNKVYKFNTDGSFQGPPLTVNKSFDSKNKEIVKDNTQK